MGGVGVSEPAIEIGIEIDTVTTAQAEMGCWKEKNSSEWDCKVNLARVAVWWNGGFFCSERTFGLLAVSRDSTSAHAHAHANARVFCFFAFRIFWCVPNCDPRLKNSMYQI